MEFKNVPAPVNCYFLLANTARDGSTPLVVPDEPVQAFEFIVSRPTSPPSTPMVAPTRSFYDSGISHSVPDINVTHPTPSDHFRPEVYQCRALFLLFSMKKLYMRIIIGNNMEDTHMCM